MPTQTNSNIPFVGNELTVHLSPFKNDGTTIVNYTSATAALGTLPIVGSIVTLADIVDVNTGGLRVVRPETATIENTKFVITQISPEVIEITGINPTSGAAATGAIRGGPIKVVAVSQTIGFMNLSCLSTVVASDALICQDGLYGLAAATSVASVAAIAAFVGYCRVAPTTDYSTLARCQVGIFH